MNFKRLMFTTFCLFPVIVCADESVEKRVMSDGEAAYEKECAICHQGFNTGVIMLEKRLGKEKSELSSRTDLTKEYIKSIVRNGLMSMPAITRVEVTDKQLDDIATYLSKK